MSSRKMLNCLTPGSIGVKANQSETIQAAHHYGFEAIQPLTDELAAASAGKLEDWNRMMREYRLVWGQASLPVEFRKDEEQFQKDLRALKPVAEALAKLGARRIGTWISPAHDTLPYLANLKQHARRLGEVLRVLAEYNLLLGLEYVGPKTLWASRRLPFIHTMAEMRELLGELRASNAGFVIDSWHWYTAGETLADLLTLRKEDVICIDLNDAPAGISLDQQVDSKRELPLATGVIDTAGFLNALHSLGCDAPVRCEPFNAALRAKPKEEILALVASSMHRALGLIKT